MDYEIRFIYCLERERERMKREREIGEKEREREQGLENTKDRNKLGHY